MLVRSAVDAYERGSSDIEMAKKVQGLVKGVWDATPSNPLKGSVPQRK